MSISKAKLQKVSKLRAEMDVSSDKVDALYIELVRITQEYEEARAEVSRAYQAIHDIVFPGKGKNG